MVTLQKALLCRCEKLLQTALENSRAEAYRRPYQTSKMKLLGKIVNS